MSLYSGLTKDFCHQVTVLADVAEKQHDIFEGHESI